MGLPAIYEDAAWRCTQTFDEQRGRVGVGLTLADGRVLRVAFDRESAELLADSIRAELLRALSRHDPRPVAQVR